MSQYQRPCRLKTLHIQAGITCHCKRNFCWWCCYLPILPLVHCCIVLCFAQGPDLPCLGSKGRPYSGVKERSQHAFQTDKNVYNILTFSALSSLVCEPTNSHATATEPQQQMAPIFMRPSGARQSLPQTQCHAKMCERTADCHCSSFPSACDQELSCRRCFRRYVKLRAFGNIVNRSGTLACWRFTHLPDFNLQLQ